VITYDVFVSFTEVRFSHGKSLPKHTRVEANISLPLRSSNLLQTLGYGNKLWHFEDGHLLMDVDLTCLEAFTNKVRSGCMSSRLLHLCS